MKSLLKNLVVFAALVIAFSSFSGCDQGANTASSNDTNSAARSNSNSKRPSNSVSTYPPLTSGIANADMDTLDGAKTKLADRKGKVLLVNLWAIWCGPCRAEMPHLVELQDRYRDQGFEVIGINVGKDPETDEAESLQAIKEFGEKMKLNYELTRINRSTASQYYKLAQMDGIPISILVGRDGSLRAVLRGGGPQVMSDMDTSIARAIGETQ